MKDKFNFKEGTRPETGLWYFFVTINNTKYSCNTRNKMNNNSNFQFPVSDRLQMTNNKLPRVVSPHELVDTLEVLLGSVDVLQLVVVDRGVTDNADVRCQLLHELAHWLVLAGSHRTRYPQTPQGRGVDSVAVALNHCHAQRFTRVYNVSTLIHRKRPSTSLASTESPIKPEKNSSTSCELRDTESTHETG